MPKIGTGGMPAHMRIGRGNSTGPVSGGYIIFPIGPITVTGGTAKVIGTPLPFDFRVERIGWTIRTVNTGTLHTLELYSNATPVVAGGTSLTNQASTFDLSTPLTSWVAPSGETVAVSGLTLSTVAGVRDVAQGRYLVANITAEAAKDIADLNIYFLGVMLSHISDSSSND